MRLDREESEVYLEDRAAKGFTVIQAVAYGGPWDGLGSPNRYGHLPLRDFDPGQPNPAYFEHVDWVIERASALGLRMALLPVWALEQINGFTQVGLSEDGRSTLARVPFDRRNAERYGHWLGERYRDAGLIWVLGGDALPLWPADVGVRHSPLIDHRPLYDAMAGGLLAGAGHEAFITFHPCGLSFSGAARPRTSLYFHDREWLAMNMIQSSHFADPESFFSRGNFDFGWDGTRNYEPIAEEYHSLPIRPVVDGEPRYEDEPVDVIFDAAKGFWTGYDSRNAAYHAVFAGACGHTYGNNSVHQFYDPARTAALEWVKSPWRTELHTAAAGQMQYLKKLMLSRPYFSRIPDNSLVARPVGTGTNHINATRDSLGSYAMVYIPDGRPVTVSAHDLEGTHLAAWWFDPRTGEARAVPGPFERSQLPAFVPPTSGPEQDWVLVLDSEGAGFFPPGG
jgi:hypothetical protein